MNMYQELKNKIAEYDTEIQELKGKEKEIRDHIQSIRALEKGEHVLNLDSAFDESDHQLDLEQKQLMDELAYSLDKASAINLLNTRKK